MKLIIIGDEDKLSAKFTEVMFYIVMEKIKNGTMQEFIDKVEKDKKSSLEERRVSDIKDEKFVSK